MDVALRDLAADQSDTEPFDRRWPAPADYSVHVVDRVKIRIVCFARRRKSFERAGVYEWDRLDSVEPSRAFDAMMQRANILQYPPHFSREIMHFDIWRDLPVEDHRPCQVCDFPSPEPLCVPKT
jgi:hypothetical protein